MSTEAAAHGLAAGSVPPQPHRGMDPGASAQPQQPLFPRPALYLHMPPPPPLLQYPWPMPFPYNPFSGFPGMGYGMVMPPFPPPPFMEAPAYVLPHSYMQPVDYRRFNGAPAAPHQNPNLNRRAPAPPAVPVRETVNTEVQTEPPSRAEGGYEEVRCDSGNGTASHSPSSSSSCSQKQGPAQHKFPSIGAKGRQDKRPGTGDAARQEKAVPLFLRATQEAQSRQDGVVQEPPLTSTTQSSRFNMWSQSSEDAPVCSSTQTEDAVKERRVSVPDILMLKMADDTPPLCLSNRSSPEPETEVGPSSSTVDAEGNSRPQQEEIPQTLMPPATPVQHVCESRMEEESRKLTQTVKCCLAHRDEVLRSLNTTHELSAEQEHLRSLTEDTSEAAPDYLSSSSFLMRRKMNESVWSVESLQPFIPSREWLLQNGLLGTQVVEMEEIENDCPATCQVNGRRDSGSAPVLQSRLVFSTPERPGSPKTQRESLTEESATREERGTNVSPSSSPRQTETVSPGKGEEGRRASGDEARSPKQEMLVVIQRQERSLVSRVEEALCLTPAAELPVKGQLTPHSEAVPEVVGLLIVPAAAEQPGDVSPSKLPLMDQAVQCTDLCYCQGLKDCRGPKGASPDVKQVNYDMTENGFVDRRSSRAWKQHWRDKNAAKSGLQHEANGIYHKPGRAKGRNGRTTRQ